MKKVVIIGGGLAGLTAGVYLSKNNYSVSILEASPKLGGRAYSFYDEELKIEIDNGQHILLGCYYDTLDLLKLIGSLKKVNNQKKLKIPFVNPDRSITRLETPNFIYPFDNAIAFLRFKLFSLKDKIKIFNFILKLRFIKEPDNISAYQWLKKNGQSDELINIFWKVLIEGALNTSITTASAKNLFNILKIIFFSGKDSVNIITPSLPLSKLFSDPASNFISRNNGCIYLSEKVEEIKIEDNEIKFVKTNKRILENIDYVISAVPYFSAKKILSKVIPDIEVNYAPIVSIQVLLKENNLKEGFYSFVDSPVQWVFNNKTHLSIVISNAEEFVNLEAERLKEIIYTELKKYLNIDNIINYQIIKEKRATFVPSVELYGKRPETKTSIKNLFLAGDWIETQLPSTIEGAVKSGKMVANEIMNLHSRNFV